tara:strand:+ start:7154 stop:8467 length:1314 start_codon:yes stop_codon:yes gene_type:complete
MTEFKGRAIVTYGRSLMAVVIAHSLSKQGIEVITCDSVGMTAASFSRFTEGNFVHADQADDPRRYLADMVAHVRELKPKDDRPYILIPTFRDGKFLSEHRDKFDGLITLAAADFTSIDQVDPKQHLVETLKPLDIAAPKTFTPTTAEDVKAAVAALSMPALIKAVDEVGGRGIEFFQDKDKLLKRAIERVAKENPPPLLQQAATGEDYCLGVLYENGELRAHMAYHNLQNMPSEGGAGAMRETIDDAPFIRAANTLMKAVGWNGIAEIDFMWSGDPDEEPVIIEVNPRFWAGLFQSVESGVDFPWLLYHLFAYGTVPEAAEAVIGTKTRVPVAWAAGAIKQALSAEVDTEGAKQSVRQMMDHVEKGELKSAFASLKSAFGKATNLDEAISLLRVQSRNAKDAKSELMLSEDPMTSLGIFFILSSLARHGKLPPEVTD